MFSPVLSVLNNKKKNKYPVRIFNQRTDVIKQVNKGVTLLLFLWMCCGLMFVLPNHGGAGLALPQNLLAWSVMSLAALWCIYLFSWQGKAEPVLPPGSALIIAGAVFWSLPLLWSPRTDWQFNAIPKVAALWGMVGFYILLLCTTSCSRLRSRWLLIIVCAALMQAAYALWQVQNLAELPRGRPYGSFQQTNVLASFLATGLACALWIFVQKRERFRRYISGTVLFVIPLVMVILQSRAGNIGAIASVLMLLLLVIKHKKNHAVLAITIMAAGTAMGLFWLYAGPLLFPDITPSLKPSSTLSRLTMLKLTWQLIQHHPVAGNGYGSFEVLYGQQARLLPLGLDNDTIPYPHNEFLYAWAEGGLAAVLGILLMVAGVFRRLWSRGGTKFAGAALLVPLAVHMNLEYPLYQSATHGLMLIMLLVVNGPRVIKEKVCGERQKPYGWLWRIALGAPVLAILVFMLTGVQTQARLTAIEEQNLLPLVGDEQHTVSSLLNPYSQFTRLDFDRHVALLVRFNFTHDPALLDRFREWGEDYLRVHNDPSVYYSLITIMRAQHRPELNELCIRAQRMWLEDPRFICPETAE